MGYPYSHTVQRELSILVGYLLVLYGRWNTVVKTVYPKKEQERRDKLLLSSEKALRRNCFLQTILWPFSARHAGNPLSR